MNADKISILMPFRNTDQFLEETVNSMLHQSYRDWELIAVDDHSTDRSREIMLGFAAADKRIKVLENTGKGIIPALRTAFNSSSGDFITRMDSDDIMQPGKLLSMISDLLRMGTGYVALGQVQYFSDDGISDGYSRYEKWINGLTASGTNYDEIYKECVIPSPCWMIHRKDLERCGGFDPDRYPEDYDLTFRFRQYGIICIPSTNLLHLWRDYPTRTSRTSEHYAQNAFLDLKVHYFLKLDYDPARPLALWGAGSKGKTIARLLKDQKVPFKWLCDNPKKIGRKIYGIELHTYELLSTLPDAQSIVSVANPEAQKDIRKYLGALGQTAAVDYFFFC